MFVCFVCLLKRNIDRGLDAKSQLWAYGYLTGKKVGTHSQDCTLYKFLLLLLCVLQEKVHVFIIVEVTTVHVSHLLQSKIKADFSKQHFIF